MKKLLLFVIVFVLQPGFAQTKVSEEQKTEILIHIWGLLKYHHPEISKGKFDFNEEFIHEFNKLEPIKYQEELNSELIGWIKKFETEKTKYTTNPDFLETKGLFAENADFLWITSSNFSSALVTLLNKIKDNSNRGNYYASVNNLSSMVEFKNDKGYEKFDAKQKSHRVLFLASFWNTMRYWNVNIYLTETPWSEVLTELIPEFISEDPVIYELAKDKLFSRLNDSHSNYNSSYLFKDTSLKFSLYGGRIVNDTLVVRSLFNQDLAKKDNIDLGDLIYSINEKKLSDFYNDKFSDRISVSNENYLKNIIEKYYLLSDKTDSLKVGIVKKDGSILEKHIRLYNFSDYKYQPVTLDNSKIIRWQKLTDDIGYINLNEINKSELKEAFKKLENTKGIVIDLRNYPKNLNVSDLPSYLYPEKKVFMKLLAPFAPSYGKYDVQTALKIISNPFSAGSKNKNYYKGKVVLLVDRTTGSMAEYFGMAIQQAPDCITVGEQTFGAVMNRNEVMLMDKTTIDFTGTGAFYPDDEKIQRNGLKINYQVKESALNYNENQYIEEALKVLQQ